MKSPAQWRSVGCAGCADRTGQPIAFEILRRSYLAGLEAEEAAARDADTGSGYRGPSTSSGPDTSPDIGF